jgi:RNA polymerase sigma factor (sigma-70 family)
MQPTDDSALLRQYAENHSDEAFAALVTRHINLVYSVALRHVGNPHQAQEITQAVFIILAKKALQLRHDNALSSWLFHATRLTANNFVRIEARRHRREQEAYMQSVLDESGEEIWRRMAPLLDTAVAALNEKDRRAIVLRFYEGRNLCEVGTALGASEDAAKKRVTRALEKLQRYFSKRGVDSTAAAIAETISANSVQAAPVALAKTVTAMAITKGATASLSTLTLIKGALKIMAWTKAKTAAASAAIVLAVGATTGVVVHLDIPHRLELSAGRSAIANHLAEPVDLSAYYDKRADHFDKEWAVVPSGFQTFYHVPFQADGSLQLWGAGFPAYGSGSGAEQIEGIPVNRRFETLYLYHTAIYWSPNNVPIYQLVFRYDDGESVTNTVRYGAEILDWYATPDNRGRIPPPASHNSKLAWHGDYLAAGKTINLRFSLTALPNPNPFLMVTSIDLYSCKTNSAGCILAMTTGKAGLMK